MTIDAGVALEALKIAVVSLLSGAISAAVIRGAGMRRDIRYDWRVLCLSITIIVFAAQVVVMAAIKL
ncbi:MAG: hypothetical protein LBS75_05235 [Synergistaceae bacterium]|jgi:hypothetical protein|nr:hypothetical protein [Synergistaceae bacterium]